VRAGAGGDAGAFPNLLANGSSGIAVGMATNIPPHNLESFATPRCTSSSTPTDGGRSSSSSCRPRFPTACGSGEPRDSTSTSLSDWGADFRLRAKWAKRKPGAGGWADRHQPRSLYQVQKGQGLPAHRELIGEKKLPLVGDVRDEFGRAIRLVIEPRAARSTLS